MSKKQVYSVLELSDHELKLLVCEFVEGRLNVLYKNRLAIHGIINNVIVKRNDVIASIVNLIAKAQETLNFSIDRILLSIPAVNLKNVTKRVNVFVDSSDRKITIDHIKSGVSELLDMQDEERIPVNIGSVRYITNGIISRKMPLFETSDVLVVSADVLHASKEIVYSYISCVEEAGLEVMDICLDSFAAAEETSIVRKMDSKYVIGLKLERTSTTLTLFEKDRILNSQIIPRGYSDFIVRFLDEHELKPEVIFRLIKNNIPFDSKKSDEQKVFAYQKSEGTQVILSKLEVTKLIENEVRDYVEYIKEVCSGIIEAGDTKIVIYGDGSDFDGINDILDLFLVPTTNYIPDILGARESAFTSMLGIFYVWNEQRELKNDFRSCTDHFELEKNEVTKKRVDIGLTQRLKRALTKK